MDMMPSSSSLYCRPFTEADDAACQRLAAADSQFSLLNGLFKAAVVHKVSFRARSAQYQKSLLLVCADSSKDNQVVGIVAVAIKRVQVHQMPRASGFVSSLHVAKAYRKKGAGRLLLEEAETQ